MADVMMTPCADRNKGESHSSGYSNKKDFPSSQEVGRKEGDNSLVTCSAARAL
jgi:hypothetical protein